MVKVVVSILNSHQQIDLHIFDFRMKGYKTKFQMNEKIIKSHMLKKYNEKNETFDVEQFEWCIIDNNNEIIDYETFMKDYKE